MTCNSKQHILNKETINMNTLAAILLIVLYIVTFLVGRMVGIIEAKEVIMKILKDYKIEP